jgi:hypothetical protein
MNHLIYLNYNYKAKNQSDGTFKHIQRAGDLRFIKFNGLPLFVSTQYKELEDNSNATKNTRNLIDTYLLIGFSYNTSLNPKCSVEIDKNKVTCTVYNPSDTGDFNFNGKQIKKEIECNKNISKKELNALLAQYFNNGEIYTVKPNNGEGDFEFKVYYIEGSTVYNLFDPRGTLQNLEDVTFYTKEGIITHLREEYRFHIEQQFDTFTNPADLKLILTLARNKKNLDKQITEKDEELTKLRGQLTEVRNELTEVKGQLDKETGKRKEPQGRDTQEEDTQQDTQPKKKQKTPRALVKCKKEDCTNKVKRLRFGFDEGEHAYKARYCSKECAGGGSINVTDLKCARCLENGLKGNAVKNALFGPPGGKRLRCTTCKLEGDVQIKTGTN